MSAQQRNGQSSSNSSAQQGLPLCPDSIENRPPPEPDILCMLGGDGQVAFELGEVVGQEFAAATNERYDANRRFRQAYAALPGEVRSAIETRLGGAPAVFVGFPHGTPPGRWRHAIRPTIDTLLERAASLNADEPVYEGEIPVWKIPRLRDVLTDLTIRAAGGPYFGVIEMTLVVDTTLDILRQKFGKRYRSPAPIELILYHTSRPPARDDAWDSEVTTFVRQRLGGAPFRRVWLFDALAPAILFVYPPAADHPTGGPMTNVQQP